MGTCLDTNYLVRPAPIKLFGEMLKAKLSVNYLARGAYAVLRGKHRHHPNNPYVLVIACMWVAYSIHCRRVSVLVLSLSIFLFLIVAKSLMISSINSNRGSTLVFSFFAKKIVHSLILPVSNLAV